MGILGHGSLLSGMLLFGCKVTGMLFGVIRGGLFVFLYRVGSKCSVPETLESRYERNNNCSATDTSGNESERVLRFVYIDASCPEGEEWCSEKAACSSPLLCLPTTLDRAVYVPQVARTPPLWTRKRPCCYSYSCLGTLLSAQLCLDRTFWRVGSPGVRYCSA